MTPAASGITPDLGRTVPVWLLTTAGFALALGISLPQWNRTSLVAVPIALFVAAAVYPKPGSTLPSLALVVLSVVVGQHGPSPLTFLFVAGIHLLFVLYGMTSLMGHRGRISTSALGLLGCRYLLWQIPAQLLALLAFLTAPDSAAHGQGRGLIVLAVAGTAALVGLALLWRNAHSSE